MPQCLLYSPPLVGRLYRTLTLPRWPPLRFSLLLPSTVIIVGCVTAPHVDLGWPCCSLLLLLLILLDAELGVLKHITAVTNSGLGRFGFLDAAAIFQVQKTAEITCIDFCRFWAWAARACEVPLCSTMHRIIVRPSCIYYYTCNYFT